MADGNRSKKPVTKPAHARYTSQNKRVKNKLRRLLSMLHRYRVRKIAFGAQRSLEGHIKRLGGHVPAEW